ncbi:MAG: hypothetical protein PWP08_1187 [Methanofollis sp.]|nr:hypothetical protein [Methanofollis sp.]
MKKTVWFVLMMFCLLTGSVAAADTSNYNAASMIEVTDVQISPDVLMNGDTATVKVTVMNTGDETVAISRAVFYGTDISVLNSNTYDSVGDIGGGTTKTFTFTIEADGSDTVYYPTFYLDFRDAGSLRYPVAVKVQSNEVQISVQDRPDVFTADRKETVTLLIGNPRENTVNGVTVTPSGDGIESTQSGYFVGDLEPDESAEVSFDVAASHSTDLICTVTYRNGMNTHTSVITIPIEVGVSKTGPIIVINNLELSSSGGSYEISGDVSNAGLEDSKSVIVTVGSPAQGTDPYPNYVIGSLDSDDFSSFEVTFTGQGLTSVPIVVQYKDDDGNDYETSYTMDLSSTTSGTTSGGTSVSSFSGTAPSGGGPGGMGILGRSGGGLGALPITQIGIILVVLVVGLVAWRKGYLGRARTALKNLMKKKE